jgi:Glycosyl transferases group 1
MSADRTERDSPIPPGAIFVSWMSFHGRSEGIARAIGIRCWFAQGGEGPAPLRYVRQWRQTMRLLRAERPTAIVVMQPPVVALWCVLRYARGRDVRIAGDLHTGAFDDPKWMWAITHILRLLRGRGMAIVTNEELKRVAESNGCAALTLHDLIEVCEPDLTPIDNPTLAPLAEKPFVLVPLSYGHDEPLLELLSAARSTPDLCWVFTGRPPAKIQKSAPTNVVFPGFLSHEDFFRAISRAGVVVAMTNNENTMQRAAYEALSYGRPLVTSDTRVLCEYFDGAAEVVSPDGDAIVAGVRRALASTTAPQLMAELRTRRIAEQENSLELLRNWLASGELPASYGAEKS